MMPNFTCSWNDATANRTTVADWSNCNGTDPNNGGGNTYDATIATGDPPTTTAITIGSVTITSPGAVDTVRFKRVGGFDRYACELWRSRASQKSVTAHRWQSDQQRRT